MVRRTEDDMAPEPPYYAVIFSSHRTVVKMDYDETHTRMVALVHEQPAFLGVESVSSPSGSGITISYWRDLEDIRRWRRHVEHARAQERGRELWYSSYRVQIAKVERDHGWAAKVLKG